MESYGGKADNLIRLKDAGFPVPDFFNIRADSIARDLAELSTSFVRSAETYAVRSSASLEDSAGTSMAGLFETFLNVPVTQLREKVEACFLSAKAKPVQDFLKAKGLDDQIKMTVIIQRMVTAELSGVLFTANPQGITNEMMAILGAGPGNLIVDAKIPVTTLIHHFQDDIDLISKEAGTPEITEQLAGQLVELTVKLKAEFGRPTDAEFSMADGKFWLLQARPITTFHSPFETILDNSNISESYPGITLPLSIDFAKTAYAGVFHGLVAGILKAATANKMRGVLDEMVTASSGRMYYQINNWYKIMKLLPLSSLYIPVWQEMMGVEQRAIETTKIALSPWTRLVGIGRFVTEFRKTADRMIELDQRFQTFWRYFYDVMETDPEKERLIELFEEMKATLLDKWDVTLLNDLQAFIYTAVLKKLVKHNEAKKAGRKGKNRPAGANRPGSYEKTASERSNDLSTNQDLNLVISQIGELESLKPVMLLSRIARVAPREFLALETAEEIRGYLERSEPFPDILREYVKAYGDRYLEELKLESRTFRTNPELLLTTIQSLRSSIEQSEALREAAGSVKDQVSAQIREQINRQADQTVIAKTETALENFPPYSHSMIYRRAVQGIRNREISRLNRTRVFGMARALFLRLGELLQQAGRLESQQDVFWLNLSEVLQRETVDFRGRVAERKLMYREYKKLPGFTRLVFNGQAFDRILPGAADETSIRNSGETILIGTGASPGIVRGEVLVVEKPADARETFGKILVTRQTDPGWVFLMANSGGLITERGSLLSHTAIIARELQKPAVVGLKGAVTTFRSGERVELDGSTGQIRRLDANESQ